jgi:hypothetical protein
MYHMYMQRRECIRKMEEEKAGIEGKLADLIVEFNIKAAAERKKSLNFRIDYFKELFKGGMKLLPKDEKGLAILKSFNKVLDYPIKMLRASTSEEKVEHSVAIRDSLVEFQLFEKIAKLNITDDEGVEAVRWLGRFIGAIVGLGLAGGAGIGILALTGALNPIVAAGGVALVFCVLLVAGTPGAFLGFYMGPMFTQDIAIDRAMMRRAFFLGFERGLSEIYPTDFDSMNHFNSWMAGAKGEPLSLPKTPKQAETGEATISGEGELLRFT